MSITSVTARGSSEGRLKAAEIVRLAAVTSDASMLSLGVGALGSPRRAFTFATVVRSN
jgi:hypothetical protein